MQASEPAVQGGGDGGPVVDRGKVEVLFAPVILLMIMMTLDYITWIVLLN